MYLLKARSYEDALKEYDNGSSSRGNSAAKLQETILKSQVQAQQNSGKNEQSQYHFMKKCSIF